MTDSKLRTLQDVRLLVRSAACNITPTSYFFERKGFIDVTSPPDAPEALNTLFDHAIELDVEDIDELPDEENVFKILINDIPKTMAVAKELQEKLPEGWNVVKSGLAYVPNEETLVKVPEDGAVAEQLDALLASLEQQSDVSEVYTNAM